MREGAMRLWAQALSCLLALTNGPAASADPGAGPINVPGDVALALNKCWHPPREGDEITVRVSFRRDGSVFGKPRMTYMKTSGGPDDQAALATSIYQAIAACRPLRFTPALGAAIAGRAILIRFVAPYRDQRADRSRSHGVF